MAAKRSSTKKGSEVLNFQITRTQFFALIVPLAFLIGLGVGFVAWGAKPVAAPASSSLLEDTPAAVNQAGSAEVSSGADDIAAQLGSLPRYDVPVSADDPSLGPEDAPIVIVEFADFECPFCQRHAQQTHPRLLAEYGDQIRFVYKDFPLSSIHANAYSAALSGQCAQEQDRFWDYHDLMFSGRLGLGQEAYTSYAEELGMDVEAFDLCIDEERYAENVQADYNFGLELGVNSTPTFFINGVAIIGAQDFSLFAEIIDFELSQFSD